MKLTKEVKTALLVISAIILLIFGYNFLKGKNLFSKEKVFYALYNNVEGLDHSSKVTINGMVVGHIIDINFADKTGKVLVSFNVQNDFEFGKNSIAKIYSTGFIGGKNIAIIPEENPTAIATDKQTLPSFIESDMIGEFTEKLDPIQARLNKVLDKTATMLTSINALLNEKNANNISQSLQNLTVALKNLETTSKSINNLVASKQSSIVNTIDNFEKTSSDLSKLSNQVAAVDVKKLSDNLNETVSNFASIADKLQTNSGTAGKLINDPKVYDNLDRATRQLDLLLQDMKLNPKRYVHFSVFGKKNKEYSKPNDSLK